MLKYFQEFRSVSDYIKFCRWNRR